MNVENAVYPQGGQMRDLLERGGSAPVVMLNLLKFRDVAAYEDQAEANITGREAYLRYAQPMQQIVEAAGGRLVFSAAIEMLVIGAVEQLWDVAALMEYPSRAAFVTIATSPEVAAIGKHRAAGLAGQLLIQVSAASIAPSAAR